MLVSRKIFKENRGVEHKVTASAECGQGHEKSKNNPVGGAASDDGENGTEEERYVESKSSADDIGTATLGFVSIEPAGYELIAHTQNKAPISMPE